MRSAVSLSVNPVMKRIENRIRKSDIPTREDFYIVSLSTQNIVYKGMLSSLQLRNYFPALTNSYFTSGLALVHSRFLSLIHIL